MKEIDTSNINNAFINDIRAIINTARSNAVRSVDFQRVLMYWHLANVSSRKNSRASNVPTMAHIL